MCKDTPHIGTTLQSVLETMLRVKYWHSCGLSTTVDLFEGSVFLSYNNLLERFNPEGKGNFRMHIQTGSISLSLIMWLIALLSQ